MATKTVFLFLLPQSDNWNWVTCQ